MRVCLLSSKGNFDNAVGKGTQRYAHELAANLVKVQHEYGADINRFDPGFGNTDVQRKVSFMLEMAVLNFWNYDIVHLPAPIMFKPPFMGKAKLITTATEFVKVSDDSPYAIAMKEAFGSMKPTIQSQIEGFITRSCVKQALSSDYMIAISTLTRDEAVEKGYNKDKVFVVNLGVDDRFRIPKPKRKPSKTFRVGYLGAHNVRKNVGFAINAFKKLDSTDAEFQIYGKGSEDQKLMKMAEGDNRIKFMGFAPEEQLVQTYDNFDVFVYPILYTGFELEILEAQARGLPVITFKGGIIPAEVRKYCIEAEDEDHMAMILKEIQENGYKQKQRKEAMDYARSFTWEKCARETLEVYQKITKS